VQQIVASFPRVTLGALEPDAWQVTFCGEPPE